jgi:hypothetical protein
LPRDETFDRKNDQRYDAEALRCHACASREHLAKKWQQDEHSDSSGVYFAVMHDDR